jgi:hypothetical protein
MRLEPAWNIAVFALVFGVWAASLGGCAQARPANSGFGEGQPGSGIDADEPMAGPIDTINLQFGGSAIEMKVSGHFAATHDDFVQWVTTAARAVSGYFGHFPVPKVTIVVVAAGRGNDLGGHEIAGRRIHIDAGQDIGAADLHDDWVMTHEMCHLAFPSMYEQYVWIQEGLATYLEPLARARIGNLSPQRVWSDMYYSMPQGLPEPDDAGLDHTHTWGRTYWGGAMFCLLADVEIRQRTANQKSLDDAMRAILDAGGNASELWMMPRVISIGDAATGTTVLRELYDQMAAHPVTPDLPALWAKLGVRRGMFGAIVFDDTAPLAAIRKSMTQPGGR